MLIIAGDHDQTLPAPQIAAGESWKNVFVSFISPLEVI